MIDYQTRNWIRVALRVHGTVDEIDPFGYDPNDLPLDAIGEVIEQDARETIETPERARSRVA